MNCSFSEALIVWILNLGQTWKIQNVFPKKYSFKDTSLSRRQQNSDIDTTQLCSTFATSSKYFSELFFQKQMPSSISELGWSRPLFPFFMFLLQRISFSLTERDPKYLNWSAWNIFILLNCIAGKVEGNEDDLFDQTQWAFNKFILRKLKAQTDNNSKTMKLIWIWVKERTNASKVIHAVESFNGWIFA